MWYLKKTAVRDYKHENAIRNYVTIMDPKVKPALVNPAGLGDRAHADTQTERELL